MKPLQDKFLKLRFSPISDNLDDIIYVLENYKLNAENHLIIGKTLDEVELKEWFFFDFKFLKSKKKKRTSRFFFK